MKYHTAEWNTTRLIKLCYCLIPINGMDSAFAGSENLPIIPAENGKLVYTSAENRKRKKVKEVEIAVLRVVKVKLLI